MKALRIVFTALVLWQVSCGVSNGQSAPSETRSVTSFPRPVEEADRKLANHLANISAAEAQETLARASATSLTDGLAQALLDHVRDFVAQKDLQSAIRVAEIALAVLDHVNDLRLKAQVLTWQAQAYFYTNEMKASLLRCNQAIDLYSKIETSPAEIGRAYKIRGANLALLGDLEEAMSDGRVAIRHLELAGDLPELSYALNNLAAMEKTLGNSSRARELYEKGLTIAQKLDLPRQQAQVLSNIAQLYLSAEEFSLTETYALRALKLAERDDARDLIPSILPALIPAYMTTGRIPEAYKTVERAFSLAQKANNTKAMIMALEAWGQLEKHQGHLDIALDKYSQELALATLHSFRFNEQHAQLAIAKLERLMGRFDTAARDSQTALNIAISLENDRGVMDCALELGKNQLALGNFDNARAAFDRAIAATERVRADAAGGDLARSKFLSRNMESYQAQASLAAKERRWADMFAISEREKARWLFDLLTQGKRNFSNSLSTSEKAEELRLRNHIAALGVRLSAAAPADRSNSAKSALDQARRDMEAFRERMYAVHPDLGRRRGDAAPMVLQQTAALLPNRSTALLEYELTEQGVYLFVITRGKDGPELRAFELPTAVTALNDEVRTFQEALGSRNPDFVRPSKRLYNILVSPAEAALAGKTSLIIVPSGSLWHVPFQALLNATGRYLLERASVTYAPSLSVLNAFSVAHKKRTGDLGLLAFGDPNDDLPDAAREVVALHGIYKQSRTKSFIGRYATKASFMANENSYDVIHLATHGFFDDEAPMYSYLILSDSEDRNSGAATAKLNADEVAEMNIDARLVVLSACETARGRYQAGEGLIGLAWSFLAAGTQSVVASQWRVESASTTELMLEFHRNLLQHMTAGEALRQAGLAVAHTPKYAHPYYWAGFELLGRE